MKRKSILFAFLIFALTTACAPGSWSNYDHQCPTYSYETECVKDGTKGILITWQDLPIGTTLLSPKHGHYVRVTRVI